jgi:hypothetical protein
MCFSGGFFTTGPFVRLRSGKGDIGDLAPASGGKATVDIEVDAAPWIAVSRVILYVSGKEGKPNPVSFDVDGKGRYDQAHPHGQP